MMANLIRTFLDYYQNVVEPYPDEDTFYHILFWSFCSTGYHCLLAQEQYIFCGSIDGK
jgi:hypothetical protein